MNPTPFGIFSSVSSPRTAIRRIASGSRGRTLLSGIHSCERHGADRHARRRFHAPAQHRSGSPGASRVRRSSSSLRQILRSRKSNSIICGVCNPRRRVSFSSSTRRNISRPKTNEALPSSCAKVLRDSRLERQPRYFAFQRGMG